MKAYLFPGQGAQTVQMADEIIAAFPAAGSLYGEALAVTGIDLRNLSSEQLEQTRFAQLAIVVHSVASLEKERTSETEPSPVAMAGFSLGEYTSLYAAGVLGFSDLLLLVNQRATLMQSAAELRPGAMFAVIGLSDDQIEKVLVDYPEVYPVNYNYPGQLVIAGEVMAAESAAERLLSLGAKRAHRLLANGAFHTPHMTEAAAALRTFASTLRFSAPNSPLYSNVTAALLPQDTDFPSYLEKHMVSPVRFTEEILRMRNDGYTDTVELGPGRILTGLVKKI
jgi:[acyl-carrier-protein] S-malonyltransferase